MRSTGDRRDHLGGYCPGTLGGLLLVAEGVGYRYKRQISEFVGPGDGTGQAQEVGGSDDCGRFVGVLKMHGVEHTARRAGSSKRYAGDEKIRFRPQLLDQIGFGRAG